MNVNIEKARGIRGWMSDLELFFLAKMAKQSQVIFEIGSYMGRSTRAMADNTAGIIYAIDPWKGNVLTEEGNIAFDVGPDIYNTFYCNLSAYVNNGRVIMCPYKFNEWPGNDHPDNYRPDFIFIDGDHRYHNVVSDINLALKFNPKIIAGHDYSLHFWPGVQKAVDEIFPDAQFVETIWWKQLR